MDDTKKQTTPRKIRGRFDQSSHMTISQRQYERYQAGEIEAWKHPKEHERTWVQQQKMLPRAKRHALVNKARDTQKPEDKVNAIINWGEDTSLALPNLGPGLEGVKMLEDIYPNIYPPRDRAERLKKQYEDYRAHPERVQELNDSAPGPGDCCPPVEDPLNAFDFDKYYAEAEEAADRGIAAEGGTAAPDWISAAWDQDDAAQEEPDQNQGLVGSSTPNTSARDTYMDVFGKELPWSQEQPRQ